MIASLLLVQEPPAKAPAKEALTITISGDIEADIAPVVNQPGTVMKRRFFANEVAFPQANASITTWLYMVSINVLAQSSYSRPEHLGVARHSVLTLVAGTTADEVYNPALQNAPTVVYFDQFDDDGYL